MILKPETWIHVDAIAASVTDVTSPTDKQALAAAIMQISNYLDALKAQSDEEGEDQ